MESDSSRPGSPTPVSTPLQPVSHDRVNVQRESMLASSIRDSDIRDSSVHDKINQFNSLAMQSKQLERKTADAALKRAMLGREEAETEMRRYRDEARLLRKQIEEGKERERRVGERLETVMENYGRAKETHAHTQTLWEKEIRRARKETFKSQSIIVKLQEELKSARAAQKAAEDALENEKTRSQAREQEAFAARYGLVGVQEQLDQALERIKVVEQERDGFKTLAKSEEDVARIAAEGKLPLPPSESIEDDEFASPRRKRARVSSITVAEIKSSASGEAELDELTRLWQWEKRRADRALDQVEYLEAECHLRACTCVKNHPRSDGFGGSKRKRPDPALTADPADRAILSEKVHTSPVTSPRRSPAPRQSVKIEETVSETRRSTIFIPTEGVFRTVSMEEAEALEAAHAPDQDNTTEPPTPVDPNPNPRSYARTPSVDPPAFALLAQERASLASLLDAPHQQEEPIVFSIPTTPAPAPEQHVVVEIPGPEPIERQILAERDADEESNRDTIRPLSQPCEDYEVPPAAKTSFNSRPHTTASFYQESTTTTLVPLRDENTDPSLAKRLLALQKTPSKSGEQPSFDVHNPALTPTMTREQALAQIRERRGRARSVAQGAATPKKQMVQGVERRDVSAPAGRVAGKVRS